jgi:hypothetical protein
MKEVFEGIFNKYKGSALENLTPGGMHTYLVDEEDAEKGAYVIIYMDKSPLEPVFNRQGVSGRFIIEGVSKFKDGQAPINDIKNSIIELYDTDDITVSGYKLTHMKATHLQQVLDDEDLDDLLWRYPVAFEIKLTEA